MLGLSGDGGISSGNIGLELVFEIKKIKGPITIKIAIKDIMEVRVDAEFADTLKKLFNLKMVICATLSRHGFNNLPTSSNFTLHLEDYRSC